MNKNISQIKAYCNKIYKIFNIAIEFIAKKLIKLDINANFISIVGFCFGLLAINFVALQSYFYAFLFVLINRFFDILDGAVAKGAGKKTEFGIFLDTSLDYIFYAGIVLGFALADPATNALAATFLLTSFCASSTTQLAYAVIAYKKDDVKKLPLYLGSNFQSIEMAAAAVLMCALPAMFMPFAIVIGIASMVKSFSIIISAYYAFVINK